VEFTLQLGKETIDKPQHTSNKFHRWFQGQGPRISLFADPENWDFQTTEVWRLSWRLSRPDLYSMVIKNGLPENRMQPLGVLCF
jgi:hypothetical protein